jgi:hypothetical protein
VIQTRAGNKGGYSLSHNIRKNEIILVVLWGGEGGVEEGRMRGEKKT